MFRGGYKLIDLGNVNHTNGVAMMHEGIYDAIEEALKPLCITGMVVDDIEVRDQFVSATVSGSNYQIKVPGYTIVIEDTDAVTITADAG